jgi:hypothetical protein
MHEAMRPGASTLYTGLTTRERRITGVTLTPCRSRWVM